MNLASTISTYILLLHAPIYASPFQEKDHSELVVNGTAILDKHEFSEQRFAEVDLGKIPVGKKIVVNLKLENNGRDSLKFAAASTHCACSEFRSDGFVVPANGELNARFKMKAPTRRNNPNASAGIVLVDDQKQPVIRINLRYELQGLLAFHNRLGVARFGPSEKVKTIEVPFYVTAPLSLKDIEVKSGDSFRDLVFELVPSPTGGVVRATIASSFIEMGGISGEISIEYPAIGLKDTHLLTVKHARSVEINPQLVRFRKTEQGHIANAIVRIPTFKTTTTPEGKGEDRRPDTNHDRRFSVGCYKNGKKINCSVKQLSPEIYRIRMRVPTNSSLDDSDLKVESSDSSLSWRIRYDDSSIDLATEFVFEN